MKSTHEPALPLPGRLWLLAALALVMTPHLLRLPPWLSVFALGVLLWRTAHDLRGWPLPGKPLRLALMFGAVAGVLFAYHTIAGREAGTALLTITLCLKLFELNSRRDAMLVVFLGYFLVVAGFLFSQSIFIGAYMFAVVLALTVALIVLNHPAAHAGLNRRYLRLAAGLLLQALPMMLLLFVLFPRISGPLWGLPKDAYAGRTGLSDSMSMGSISHLIESPAVAFRVQFDGPVPPPTQLYWRGPVLWHSDGRHWTRLESAQQRAPQPYTPLGGPLGYTVTLEPEAARWLFALDLPAQVPADATVSADYQVQAKAKVTQRRRDHFVSYPAYHTGPLPMWQRRAALQLPAGRNPRTLALAQGWQQEGLTPAMLVKRALDYFRTQPFYYTRQPPLLGADPVDEFLFHTRRGFCEHYAAAFVTLMRAAGVPARIVTGYQGGEMNPLGKYLIVRQSDAHAWAEVWLAQRGWTRVDPTAVIPPARVETPLDFERFRTTTATPELHAPNWLADTWLKLGQGWDAMNNAWNQWVLGYSPDKQAQLLKRLGLGDLGWSGVIGTLFGGLGVLFAAVAAWLLARRGPSPDPSVRLYSEFCRKLARRGLPRHPNEGPRDYAARIAAAHPEWAAQVTLISDLYAALRYGPHPAADRLERLRRHIAAFRP